jgi:hypothetical protein
MPSQGFQCGPSSNQMTKLLLWRSSRCRIARSPVPLIRREGNQVSGAFADERERWFATTPAIECLEMDGGLRLTAVRPGRAIVFRNPPVRFQARGPAGEEPLSVGLTR